MGWGFERVASLASNSAQVLAVLIVPIAIWAWRRYRKGPGSRRVLAGLLDGLATGIQAGVVEAAFGAATFRRVDGRSDWSERIYVTRHAAVQTVAKPDGSLAWWSVSVTDPSSGPECSCRR